MVTFEVEDVVPAAGLLATRPLADLYDGAIATGGDPALPVVPHHGVHPLLSAIGLAFNDHRPLVLTPDAVWLTIAQGVAQHVRLNAETLRPRLVRHTGGKKLALDPPALPETADQWDATVASIATLLAAEIGSAGPAADPAADRRRVRARRGRRAGRRILEAHLQPGRLDHDGDFESLRVGTLDRLRLRE